MGGRLDATNVVNPFVSVISNISLDHRNHLGNSLAAIACEKGGIIKNKGVCITAAKQKQVVNIFEDICMQRRATLFMLGRDMKIRMNRDGTFNYRGIWKNYENLICSLKGRHQIENAALAIGAVESMREKGFEMDDEAVLEGIRSTKWEGRLEFSLMALTIRRGFPPSAGRWKRNFPISASSSFLVSSMTRIMDQC
jgi:dihydrofolate synthase/folylpolyglutamate synthase